MDPEHHPLTGETPEEMAAFGGGEAFLRWVRSEDDDPPEDPEPRAQNPITAIDSSNLP
jgi:hypothetical protein